MEIVLPLAPNGSFSSYPSPISILVSITLDPDFDPAKRGAGGRGRRGLPPYFELGVPGRGLPLRSEGS